MNHVAPFWRMTHAMALCVLTIFVVGLTSVKAQAAESTQQYPNVVAVKVKSSGADTFNFDATISSPYDSAQRYADAFRVIGIDGQVFGERKLLHDHADEQPFTRDLYFVKIPRGIRVVVVQARDQKYGYGGNTVDVILPGR